MVNKEDRLQEVVAAVTKAALADGKITQEEAEILEAVQINTLIYEQALADALDDGIITNEEKDTLEGLKQQILSDAWDIAAVSDSNVSNDELKMLEVLLKKIEEQKE
ncbi:MAG: hypothetical protein HeimC2_06360 [Candidatus Heimdallarchaeota archaeon LC_2]|nr:MAG: hypothetical protein HeimC2_38320 [Candidatus Heimdallarchaeota archaeon LC_2]OLS28579.1 MAG: hypothetical protein HeimC2_06360 [Candidatus Heimdallarchaeota archaeon LC_2]